MTFLIVIFIIVFVLAPLANAAARRLNPPRVPGAIPGDLARLREELDQLSAQVTRLQEEQGFMLRLLTEGEKEGDALRLGRAARTPTQKEDEGGTEPDTPNGGL